MRYKIVSLLIILPYLIRGQQTLGGKCSQDWNICETTGECVPSSCQNVEPTPSSTPCGTGQVYCVSAGACVPGCPRKLAAYTRSKLTTCEGELVYCMSQSSCLPPSQCKDSFGSQNCPSGTFFCMSTGKCQSNTCGPVQGQASCPVGLVFCQASGKCQLTCFSGRTNRQSRPTTFLVPLRRCPPGKVFDNFVGMCTAEFMDSYSRFAISEETSSCADGLILCASSGLCTEENKCDASVTDIETSATSHVCKRGKVFCIATQSCTWENRCNDNKLVSQKEDLKQCPAGQVFCATNEGCIESSLCDHHFYRLSSLIKGQSCDRNEVFCLSTGTCEKEGNCGARPEHTFGTMCPRGYVYCVERQECVPSDKGCGDTGSSVQCAPGTVFCTDKGQCSADCGSLDITIWRPEMECPVKKGAFNYSNCITSNHCPFGYQCCPDTATLHLQCVGSNNTIATDVLTSISCPMLAVLGENSDTGVTCHKDPSECPPSSLCCNGTCRTPRGTSQCPPFTLFCSLTKKCEKLGSPCGEVCPPGKVYCITEGSCNVQSQCEFDHTSGAPWMLTGPVILTPSGFMSPTEKRLNYLFKSNGSTIADVNLIVRNMLVGGGVFQVRNETTNQWVNVTAGSTISTSNYLQYVPPPSLYNFGLTMMNVTEQSTNISRLIVQLLSPEPPEVEFTLREPWLTTVEDELQMMTLGELFIIVDSDWMYWDVWKKALGLPFQSAKLGLIDFAHPTTLAWVSSLTRPDFTSKGKNGTSHSTSIQDSTKVNRGIRIEYGHKQKLEDEPLIFLDVSEDGGRSWIQVNPVTPHSIYVSKTRSIADTLIRMSPAPNAFGNTSFLFTPIVLNSNNSSEQLPKMITQKLDVVILPMNDAPLAMANADLEKIPTFNPTNSEIRLSANKLASIFYMDPDGDKMGVAIHYARTSDFGNWSYSDNNGTTWHEITDLNQNPLGSGMLMSGRYQGFIITGNNDPLKSPDIVASLTGSVSRNPNQTNETSITQSTPLPKKPQSIFTGTSDGNFEVDLSLPSKMVSALLLPPSVIISYRTKNTSQHWTVADAISRTRLMFTAWDTTDVKVESMKVQRKNMSLTHCSPECGSYGSYSNVPATILADWTGCDGGEIVDGTIKVIDRCGVCGGDGQSCVDCHFVVNGTAVLDCGKCIGGTTGITSVRDCAGECGNNNVEKQFPEGKVCIHVSELNALPCDGFNNSGAYINECGVCVGGRTNLTKDASKDQCGVCNGKNECLGCDGIQYSGKVFDMCGMCLSENDINFNEGCKMIGDFQPTTEDIARVNATDTEKEADAEFINPDMAVSGSVVGISANNYKLNNCSFFNTASNQSILNTHASYQNGKLKLSLSTLKIGNWNVTCTFEVQNPNQTASINVSTSKLVTIQSVKCIKVVNSTTVEIASISPNKIIPGNDTEITVTLKNSVDLTEAFCILKYKTEMDRPQYVKRLRKLRTQDGVNITCKIDPFVWIGTPDLSVVLTEPTLDTVKSNKVTLPSMPVSVLAVAPKVKAAYLSSFGSTLSILFDVNIEMSNNCQDNFAAKAILGQGPVCEIQSAELTIKLGMNHNVTNGTNISFDQNNNIHQRYGKYAVNPPGAIGSTIVLRELDAEPMRFSLVGDNTGCNGSIVKLEAILDQIPNPSDYKVIWNVTWVKSDLYFDPQEVQNIYNSTMEIQNLVNGTKNDRVVTFPGSKLRQNISYLIMAMLEGPNENEIDPQGIQVKAAPKDKSFLVNIKGPNNIYADKHYSYQAEIKYCKPELQPINYMDVTYFWNINKDTEALHESHTSPVIDLQPGTLHAKNTYTISALVVNVNEESALGTMDIKTLPQRVKAIVGAQRLTVGSSASFMLDGSGSINPIGPSSDLTFRWSCELADANGTKCYTSQGMQRFENAIPMETLLSNTLIVPPILPPKTYIFSLEVSNSESSNKAKTTVEILPGILPQLFVSAPSGAVDVNDTVNIYGFVTSPPMTSMVWQSVDEPGFEFADIYNVASAAKTVTIKGPSSYRPFTLTIAPPGGNWAGLKPGARYKFRLSASLGDGPSSKADAVIQTKSPPVNGSFMVTPSSGQALVTNFTFKAVGWSDLPEDLPLKAHFGYRVKSSGNVVWMDTVIGSNLTLVEVLTADSGSTMLTPLLKVCDSTESCTNLEGNDLTVTIPNQLPDSALLHLSEDISKKLEQDDKLLGALAQSGEILATLRAMGATSQLHVLVDILEFHLSAKVEMLKERLASDPKNENTRQAAKDMLSGSLDMLIDGYPFSTNILYSIVSLADNLIAALTNAPPRIDAIVPSTSSTSRRSKQKPDAIYYPSSNEDLDAARNVHRKGSSRPGIKFYAQENRRKNGTRDSSRHMPETSSVKKAIMSIMLEVENSDDLKSRSKRSLMGEQSTLSEPCQKVRIKRDAGSNNSSAINYTALSVNEVTNFLTIDETNILNAQSQSNKTIAMDKLTQNINTYIAGLCLSMTTEDKPLEVQGNLVSMRVFKSQMLHSESDQKYVIADANGRAQDFINVSSNIIWGPIVDQYKEWACDSSNPKLKCYGACLCTVEYESLFAAPYVRATIPGSQRGHLIRTALLHPTKGYEIFPSSGNPLYFELAISNTSVAQNEVLKCFGWKDDQWNSAICKNSLKRIASNSSLVPCNCMNTGYLNTFVVGLSSPFINGPTTAVPSQSGTQVYTSGPSLFIVRNFTMTLDGNYSVSVLGREEAFKQELTSQLSHKLSVGPNNIRILSVTPGSIVVQAQLVENNSTRASGGTASIDSVYSYLVEAIKSGDLVFAGLDSEQLRVLPTDTTTAAVNQSYLPILIGGIVAGVLLIAIVIVVLAIYFNKKKRFDKVSPINGNLPPTYRAIHFENSLNGNAATFTKNNKSGSKSSNGWDPNMAAYTEDGLYIERNSAGRHSKADSGIAGDDYVPEAFNYKSPTKKQLENTGPIPEHILKQLNRASMPGTPDNH